jgi:hypothetical protein
LNPGSLASTGGRVTRRCSRRGESAQRDIGLNMKPTRKSDLPNVPWITTVGAFDPAKFPIDPTLQQCVGLDLERFRSGCRLLELSEDSAFSYTTRAKFKIAAEGL